MTIIAPLGAVPAKAVPGVIMRPSAVAERNPVHGQRRLAESAVVPPFPAEAPDLIAALPLVAAVS